MTAASALEKLRKLRGKSLPELQDRGTQAALILLERLVSGQAVEPSDARFRQWLRTDSSSLELRGFPQSDQLRRAAAFAVDSLHPGVAKTIAAADRVIRGRYDLLGYTDLSFGREVDWHFDPVAGKNAPHVHWSKIRFLDATQVGDHKVIWEINRHHHLVLLGRAYALTGDESYARTCAHQFSAWMDANPPKVGINWASSLEVSYRLIAWIWCLRLFEASPSFHDDLRRRILKYAHVHASHVERYLSTYFSPNTHLTGEALGLWYAGNAMPFFRRAERWKAVGWSILQDQINRQVHPDGVYFEQASYYQRYSIDIYMHAMLIAQSAGFQVPPSMVATVERMAAFLAAIARPDGTIPLIGDDDGGQLVRLEERHCSDARAVFASTSIMFRDAWYRQLAPVLPEEALWLFGTTGIDWYAQGAQVPQRPATTLYPNGGYAVMRDAWTRDSSSITIDCGPLGMANGGHGHADALAVVLTVHGRPLFIDPGTFTYTGDLAVRNRFRASQAHNTVSIDETSSSVPDGPFTWKNMAAVSIDAFIDSDAASFFAGTHDGYLRLSDPVRHQRRVLFLKNAKAWVIWDVVEGLAPHSVSAVFQCPADVHAALRTADIVDFTEGDTPIASMKCLGDGRMEIASGTVSECYGSQRPAPVCRALSLKPGRHDLVFIVVAAREGLFPDVAVTAEEFGWVIDMRRRDSMERVQLSKSPNGAGTTTGALNELSWSTGLNEDDLSPAGSWRVAR